MPVDMPHAVINLHALSSLMATASAKKPWKPENLAIDPTVSRLGCHIARMVFPAGNSPSPLLCVQN
jgi:hypothetical protein